MSRRGKSFELGGVIVPWSAGLGLNQEITLVDGGNSMRRMMSGRAEYQEHWTKWAITLSADGWSPHGLGLLDYTEPMVLRCGLPEAVRSQSTAIALPLKRRTDAGYEPFARAHLADGTEKRTALSIASHVATLTPVAGAVSYAVWYWPEFTVIASRPTQGVNHSTGNFGWSLNAEES